MTRADRDLARKRRQRRNRKVLGWLAVAAAVAAAAAVVYLSPWLTVQRVEVLDQLRYTTAQDVIAAADIRTGTPIALVDAIAVEEAVTALPAVKSVEVRRVWPDRILLAVSERVPVAAISWDGGWQLVDREGNRFASLTDRPKEYLAVAADTTAEISQAAKLAAALPDWLRALVNTIAAESPDDLRFELPNGSEVRWGNASRSARKAQVLQVLLGQAAKVYDVSAPDVPATRK